MNIDLGILENFEITASDSWNNWQFNDQQHQNMPLSFFSRFDRIGKCYDLALAPNRKEDSQFIFVDEYYKQQRKQYIAKDYSIKRQKVSNLSLKPYSKKLQKNYRPYTNQIKTKFKQVAVKKDWRLIKSINKNFFDGIGETKATIDVESTKGKLHYLNSTVQKISWTKKKFKQNEQYIIKPVCTLNNKIFKTKILDILSQDKENRKRKTVICSLQFLLALLTVRNGQYPWSISIEKDSNLLILQNYNETSQANNLTYLDLFTENQNTSNNMPKDEGRLKQYAINATKLTKIFKDLLASGDVVEDDRSQEQQKQIQQKKEKEVNEDQQNEDEDDQEEQEELQRLEKYVKITVNEIDIYTKVTIDGLKEKSTGQTQQCLIRTFVETETDGAWIKDITTSTGKIVTQQYQSNAVSLQKWVCEAKIAGVNLIKTGYIGISKGEPFILNVDDVTVKTYEDFLSFKINNCWPIVGKLFNLLFGEEDGSFVLSRAAYTPLSVKLYKLPKDDQDDEDEQNQNQA